MSIELLLLVLLSAQQSNTITVRGQVVCSVAEKATVKTVGDHEHEYVFKTDLGQLLPLFKSITSRALFVDNRLQERYLEVTGELREDRSIEVFQIRSIIGGQLHDVHYWCDTCAIRANSPGPCWCCYQPFEFREIPMGPAGPGK